MRKWYLHSWWICILFVFWQYIIPPIIGVVLLILQHRGAKKFEYDLERESVRLKIEAEEYSRILRAEAEEYSVNSREEVEVYRKNEMESVASIIEEYDARRKKLESEERGLKRRIKDLQGELEQLNGEILLEYVSTPIDDDITSEECKNRLSVLRTKQNDMIKDLSLLKITAPSTEAKSVVNNNIKQILKLFALESDVIISSVTTKNIDACRNKLRKAFETINRIYKTDHVELTYKFLEMKLEELSLVFEHAMKQELEKEEQKAIRQQMIEEEKVRKEIEREKIKIEKEETQFRNEISKLMKYMQKASEIEKRLYIDKITELEEKLRELEKTKQNVFDREQNTRAGFVYIISNIGSFGENVFKIGMTRRLEPMDRINELSSASVPFEFDVHAMIFSEDAPALENTLHTMFRRYQVNKVNNRKEFFKVPLTEIEAVVKKKYNATVAFTLIAKAEQYRETLRIEASDGVA